MGAVPTAVPGDVKGEEFAEGGLTVVRGTSVFCASSHSSLSYVPSLLKKLSGEFMSFFLSLSVGVMMFPVIYLFSFPFFNNLKNMFSFFLSFFLSVN